MCLKKKLYRWDLTWLFIRVWNSTRLHLDTNESKWNRLNFFSNGFCFQCQRRIVKFESFLKKLKPICWDVRFAWNKHQPFPSNPNFTITAPNFNRNMRRIEFPCRQTARKRKDNTKTKHLIPLRAMVRHTYICAVDEWNGDVCVVPCGLFRRTVCDERQCMCSLLECKHKQRQYRQIHTQAKYSLEIARFHWW